VVRSRLFLLAAVLLWACSLFAQLGSDISDLNITFTTIDVPGAPFTNIYGINSAGDMVGGYSPTVGPDGGFLYSGGNFSLFTYPNADSTSAFGINDSGLISGAAYIRGNTEGVGFLYEGATFTTLRAPGDGATLARGLNNAGIVTGGDGLSLSSTKGFALIGKQFKTVSPPGVYTYVFANGINNLNQIVGTDDNGGFLYSNGRFKTISYPGASQTQPTGINDSGIVVGWYSLGYFTGFALKNGKYISISYPGAVYTFALGINNLGQVVGSYTLDQQSYHGFITSPITEKSFKQGP
jgi:probable HAF family extracellular repeat protein